MRLMGGGSTHLRIAFNNFSRSGDLGSFTFSLQKALSDTARAQTEFQGLFSS